MAKDTTKVNLGHADVSFKGESLGHIRGGVTVNLSKELAEAFVDDFGETAIFAVDNGTMLTVTVPMAQLTADTLEVAYPYENRVGDTIEIGQVAGGRSDAIAGELIVTPTAGAFAGQALTLYKAAVSESSDLVFSNGEQTVVEVTFKAYVDETSESGVLGVFGPVSES